MRPIKVIIVLLLSLQAVAQETTAEPAHLAVNRDMMVNFLKSLVIPGWGQWSSGHRTKAAVFLAAELGAILGYDDYFSRGEDEARKFKDYANEHWYYGDWLDRNGWDVEETACGNVRTHRMDTLLDGDGHQILDENGYPIPLKDHHYYENISKYPEFICGWDDIAAKYEEDGKDYTPNKLSYIKMRTHSNTMYQNAQVVGTLIFANHLISAIDAAFGTDVTTFGNDNYEGKFYIDPLNTMNSIRLEVKF